jgi:hypothetical protein
MARAADSTLRLECRDPRPIGRGERVEQLVLRDRDPDWPPPEDLAGRVPVEPLGAVVPARDHAVERHADDRVVRGLHDRRRESQPRFGLAPLLGDVDSGSATIATIPMKACRRSDGWWVSRTNGPDPHTVPPTLGCDTSSHVVKDRPMQVLVLVRVAQVRRFCWNAVFVRQ